MVKKELRINLPGNLSKKDFQKLTKAVEAIFLKYDINRSGVLDSAEIKNMMKDLYK